MKYFSYLVLFFTFLNAALTADNMSEVPLELKERKPNWHVEIIETYEGGNPKKVLFFNTNSKGELQAEKRVMYYENGTTFVEEDLIEKKVQEGEKKSVLHLPHGVCVSFYPSGELEKKAFLKEGKLHGSYKGYYPGGKEKFHYQFEEGNLHGSYTSYYENGRIREEAQYDQGKIIDTYASFYENGENASLKSYKNGVLEGASIEWYKNGHLKSNHLFHEGRLHASGKAPAIILYDEDEHVVETLYAKEGVLDGLHQKYYPNSVRRYQVNYVKGKKEGKEEFFSEDGGYLGGGEYVGGVPIKRHLIKYPNGLFQKIACYNEQGDLIKPIEEYHQNGQISKKYSLNREEKTEGPCFVWDEEGHLKCEYLFKEGAFHGLQKEYYPQGQIKICAQYQMGKQHGPFEQWYENGNKKIAAQMVEGRKEGAYRTWYENGQQEIEEHYLNGELTQDSKSWYENGKLKQLAQYKDGKLHGAYKMYLEEGQLSLEANYVEGKKEGLFQTWYPQGGLREKVLFSNGKKEGLEETFYENGVQMTSFCFSKGQKDGPFLSWFEDGSPHMISEFKMSRPVGHHKEFYPLVEGKHPLKAEMHYKNYIRHGKQAEYYPSGQPKMVIHYLEGKISGLKKRWDESGLVLEELNYKDNALDGPFFMRHKDGSEEVGQYKNNLKEGKHCLYYSEKEGKKRVLALEAEYRRDQLDGWVKEYHSSGKLVAVTPYKENKKEGEAKIYDLDGALRMSIEYKGDVCDGKTKQYFAHGQLFKETIYVQGKKEGRENTYFEKGELAGQTHYKEGLLDGLSFTKNKDGITTFEGEYKRGKRHGKFNKFYDSGEPKVIQFFVEDRLEGIKKIYTPDGDVKELQYEMGKKVK